MNTDPNQIIAVPQSDGTIKSERLGEEMAELIDELIEMAKEMRNEGPDIGIDETDTWNDAPGLPDYVPDIDGGLSIETLKWRLQQLGTSVSNERTEIENLEKYFNWRLNNPDTEIES